MASPVDAARVGTNITGASDPWSVTLPSHSAGDLLVVYGRTGGSATFNLPSGWSWVVQNNSSDAADDNVSVICKLSDGTEGTSLSWDLSGTAKGAAIAWRITGAANPASRAPEVQVATFTTTANTANPPSISPTGGSKDYLFLALAGEDQESITFSVAPTNYTNLTNANSGTSGLNATNVCIGGASRQLTAASEDPSTFTHGAAATGGLALTVAIHPPLANVQQTLTANYNKQVSVSKALTANYNILASPTQTTTARISLASGTTPDARNQHSIHVTARTVAGAGVIRAQLWQGGTQIGTGYHESTALTNSLVEYTLAIGDTDANSITDYSNLEVRFWGYSANGGSIVYEVDQVWLEIPAGSGTSAVSKDLTANYTIVGRVAAKTLTANYTIRRNPSQTLTANYTIRRNPSKDLTANYVIRRNPSKALTANYNIIKQISKVLTANYNIIKQVSKALTAQYNIASLSAVSKALTAQYNIIARVAPKQLTANYTVKQVVSKALTSNYNKRVTVNQSLTAIYTKLAAGATQTSVARISLASGYAPHPRTNHVVKIRARVTSGTGHIRTQLFEGDIDRSGVLQVQDLTTTLTEYSIPIADDDAASITDYSNLELRLWGYSASGGAIVFEVDQLWLEIPLTAAVPKTLTANYNKRVQVSKALTANYNVQASPPQKTLTAQFKVYRYGPRGLLNLLVTEDSYTGTSAVSKTLTSNYNIVGRVSKALTAQYTIKRSVSKTLTANYNVKRNVSKTLTAQYNILSSSAVLKSLTANYNKRVILSKTLTANYNIRLTVSKALTANYNKRVNVSKALTANYNKIGRIPKQLTANYNKRVIVSKTLTANYNKLSVNQVSKQLGAQYNVRRTISKTLTTNYNVASGLVSVTQTLTSSYDIVARVTKTLIARYTIQEYAPPGTAANSYLATMTSRYEAVMFVRYSVKNWLANRDGSGYNIYVGSEESRRWQVWSG